MQTRTKTQNARDHERLKILVWAIAVGVSLVTFMASVGELIEHGGNRLGYVPWPGAGTINLAFVSIWPSAVVLLVAGVRAVKRLIRGRSEA